MSTYNSYYTAEERRKAEERANAPKTCPRCGTAINRSPYGKIQTSCGDQACRKVVSRHKIAERKKKERDQARLKMLTYCNDHLTGEQRRKVMNMVDLLMSYSYDEGHTIAQGIIDVIEDQRCKHDHIKILLDARAAAEKQAEKSADYVSELESLYLRRIDALERQIKLYESLDAAIYEIALDQERKQPDPIAEPPTPFLSAEDAEAERTRAQLRSIGITPISDLSAEDLAALDGDEGDEGDEGEEQEGEEYEQGGEYGAEEESQEDEEGEGEEDAGE